VITGVRVFVGATVASVVFAVGSVVAFHNAEQQDHAGGGSGERCDRGVNTAAYNAVATRVDSISPHAAHGRVDFTIDQWAEAFTDPDLGVPAAAVAAAMEATPSQRELVMTGKVTHSITPDPWVPLTDPAQCRRLRAELRTARAAAARYPTVADAVRAGYRQSSQYAPGQGAHYTKRSAIDGTFDPGEPELLMYDGSDDDSAIMGMSYYLLAPDGLPTDRDVGFTGPDDQWHEHTSLCLDDQGVAQPDSECAAGRGTQTPDPGGWMTHAWLVPGCESDWGVFSGSNPRVVIIPTPETPFAPGCNSGKAVTDRLTLPAVP
jgi:hypothetical protein